MSVVARSPAEYLLLTLEEREERLDGSESRNSRVKHSPVVDRSRLFGACG